MADQILDDDLPSVPKVFTPVRVACSPVDEAMARLRSDYAKSFISAGMVAPSDLETLTDEDLTSLALEPEFLANCTPLEIELISRLAARLEYERAVGI